MPFSISYLLYVVGVVLLLVALFAFIGFLHLAWPTPLVVGVILLALGALLARRDGVRRL